MKDLDRVLLINSLLHKWTHVLGNQMYFSQVQGPDLSKIKIGVEIDSLDHGVISKSKKIPKNSIDNDLLFIKEVEDLATLIKERLDRPHVSRIPLKHR